MGFFFQIHILYNNSYGNIGVKVLSICPYFSQKEAICELFSIQKTNTHYSTYKCLERFLRGEMYFIPIYN